jgi:hypothetical protein
MTVHILSHLDYQLTPKFLESIGAAYNGKIYFKHCYIDDETARMLFLVNYRDAKQFSRLKGNNLEATYILVDDKAIQSEIDEEQMVSNMEVS